MTLMQMHWQAKDGNVEFVAQKEISSTKSFRKWVRELHVRHPPPEEQVFMACDERSKHFMGTKQPQS